MAQSGLKGSGLPTNIEHKFNRVPAVTHPRSTFDRSSSHKMTFDPNVLFPCYYDQIYPGDTKQLSGKMFARILAPLQRPIMDNIYLDWFAFFVPERLVWDNFQKSMGEQANPGDSTNFLAPVITAAVWTLHSLGDYFNTIGAVLGSASRAVNAIKFRAYNKIMLDWFHDQNLMNSPVQNRGDGPDLTTDYPCFTRRKRLDYFTGCLPFAQKGNPVTLPVGGTAPIVWPTYLGVQSGFDPNANDDLGFITSTASVLGVTNPETAPGDPVVLLNRNTNPGGAGGYDAYTNLAAAVGITVNAFRLFVTTQQFLEMNARAGTRYIEQNLAHFGVVSPDARLQRSEFLGGGTIPINVHPLAQTSSPAGGPPQGNLAAFSTMDGNVSFSHSFVEHGFVIIVAETRADLTYWQGIAHDNFERAQLDRYYPVFANIGEQGILSQELYCDGTGGDLTVFGYQEAWAHLRYKPSTIAGYFRPDAGGTLDMWHLSQDFGVTRPTLNSTFISENMPIGRVVTDNASPFFILDTWFSSKDTRVLPVFSVPGLLRL